MYRLIIEHWDKGRGLQVRDRAIIQEYIYNGSCNFSLISVSFFPDLTDNYMLATHDRILLS